MFENTNEEIPPSISEKSVLTPLTFQELELYKVFHKILQTELFLNYKHHALCVAMPIVTIRGRLSRAAAQGAKTSLESSEKRC